jgi:chromatin remodeling complex protein RSC6
VLQYAAKQALFVGKDRRVFACDDTLRTLLEVDTVYVHSLRARLVRLLQPLDPIEFDLTLSHLHTAESLQTVLRSDHAHLAYIMLLPSYEHFSIVCLPHL